MPTHKTPIYCSLEEQCFYEDTPKHVLFDLLRDVYEMQTNTSDDSQGAWLVELKKLVEKEDIRLVSDGDVYLQKAFTTAEKVRQFREKEKVRKARLQEKLLQEKL
jgi:hypothetical protein